MSLLSDALEYQAHGYSVVPAATNGTKAPAFSWKQYATQAADATQVNTWFQNGRYDGLGLICGAVSGNLEMLEIEGRALHMVTDLATLLNDNGYTDLWARLCAGYLEQSPSGGMHWLYRVDGPARPNTKLARRPGGLDPATGRLLVDVLIETRGEGGFTVAAPSTGRTHPTGKAWTRITGTPATIPTISIDDRDALHAICTMLDQMPADEPTPVASDPFNTGLPTPPTTPGTRPGDDYNQRTSWNDILGARGWTITKRFAGGTLGWTRPGKTASGGISATTGATIEDRLYVFSSSTEFDTEKPYNKFAAYTLLEHHGNYGEAASALAKAGYGAQAAEPTRSVDLEANAVTATQQTDGNLATVLAITPPAERHLEAVKESTLQRSDDGNALILIDRFGDRIRYIAQKGRWIAWNGSRWEWCPSGGGIVREYAKRVARALPAGESPAITHKKKSLSANGTTAMIQQAETDERITTGYDKLDAHPLELNTPAGAVNLITGAMAEPDQTKLHTRSTDVTPNAEMPTPLWLQFLADTFEGAEEVLPFVQRLAGYSATGIVSYHILPFLHGPGGNGKSVFLDVIRVLLGDYAGSAPAKFLMSAQPQHETEIARLAGLRMVICSEVNQQDKFDEAKVKILTGGDALTARFMRQDHFTFNPTHHLWLMGNHQPKVAGGGEAFWRRLRIVSFANVVPEERKIDGLAQRLVDEEGPGILAWIITGAQAALATGLQAPVSVMAATDTYASEEDILARFITDRCNIGGGTAVRTATAELRAAYTQWCHDEGEQPLNPQVFGRELRTRYDIEQMRSNGKRYYLGITIYAEETEPDEPAKEWYP